MEEIGTIAPSLVVAVGLTNEETERLQAECSDRRIRLVNATRQADLPLSVQCDVAIIGMLLPDSDGRRLAVDFVRAGAKVLLLDDGGSVSLLDAWSIGASTAQRGDDPADWLDIVAHDEHVEVVSRAGRLLAPLALADAVSSSASFSSSTGVSVSFVWIRPLGDRRTGIDEALDRLTSVVGMATVFYDAPSGDRLALVVNGDRRRLTRLLDDAKLKNQTNISVIEVSRHDDLWAMLGRSRLGFGLSLPEEVKPKILVAVAPGQEKAAETIRAALHRMDCTPIFWDPAFQFEEVRSAAPIAAIVDTQLTDEISLSLIESGATREPPIPSLVLSGTEDTTSVRTLLEAGASDFLIWPFELGEVQAAIARVATEGVRHLVERVAATEVLETDPSGPDGDELEPVLEEEQTPMTVSGTVDDAAGSEPDPDADDDADPGRDRVEQELIRIVGNRLAAGESVVLEGIGVLDVRHETSRIVHDKLGRTIVEPPKRSLTFTPLNPSDDESPE